MFKKVFSLGGTLVLAGAMVLFATEPSQARGPGGGGHGGGGHGGGYGGHAGGYSRGGYGGGYSRGGYGGGYGRGYGYGGYGRGYGYGGYGRGYGYGYSPFGLGLGFGLGYGLGSASYGSYYPSYNSYGSYDATPYYVPSIIDSTSAYQPLVPRPGSGVIQSSYDDSTPALPTQAANTAHIHVRVPANARVWFDNYQTQQSGADRNFHTPPLTPGEQYSYRVRVQWQENGRPVTQTQEVDVTAGANRTITFPVSSVSQEQSSTPGTTVLQSRGNMTRVP